MKKVKYLSVAVAIAALSSCQSDDLNFGESSVQLTSDGSEVYVTIADVEEELGTRAGFAVNAKPGTQAMGQLCLFEEGDQFKMYCADTWKPQVYKFKQMAGVSAASGQGEAAVFEYAEDTPYNKQESEKNREYGVFPADMFYFNDEYRKELVFKLPTLNEYGNFAPSTANSTLTGSAEMSAWHALVPMFGIYKPTTETVGFYYMTSLIRVQALGMTPGEKHTLTLSSKKYKLSGTFKTENFNSAEFDVDELDGLSSADLNTAVEKLLPVFDREEAKDGDEQSITITFTPTATNPDVVLYLPLPTGEYETNDLTLTLDNNDITESITYRTRNAENTGYDYTPLSEVTETTLKLGRGVTNTNLYAIVENNIAKDVTTLKDINDLLEDLTESYDRNVTVDVNIKGENGIVVNDLESEIDAYRKLIVPTLPYNVTLNINGKITAAEGKKLNIVGGGGEGTLTINYLYNGNQTDFAPIAIEEGFANDVVLKTTAGADGKYVKFAGLTAPSMTGDLTLEGMFAGIDGVNVEGTLTLKNYVHHIGSTWKGPDDQIVEFSVEDVRIEGDCSKMACAVVGGNLNNFVKQDDPVRTVTFDFGTESTVTFGEGAKVYGVKAGTVTVDEDAEVSAVETSQKLTITDAQVNAITLNGGEATIDAVDKTINTVVLKAPATINLNNGIINTISKTYTYDKNGTNGATNTVAKVNSKGKSAIVDVTEVGNWINFYSEWNGEEISYLNFSYCTAIYTAAQFMNVSQFIFGKYTLYTDVDLKNNEYKLTNSKNTVVQKSRSLANGFEGVVRDNGETTTIKNFTLVNPYDAKMNIGLFGMTNVGYNKVVVKNLHIENVNNSFTNDVENVGVLFGKVTREIDIENVVVKNASLKCSDESYNIGGLIGYVESGNVNVVATTVETSIEGYYNLGGIIGSVAKDAKVTFGKTKNVAAEGVKAGGTTIKVIKDMPDEKETNAGKVGLAVGELNGTLSLQYFSGTWSANDVNKDWKYDKCRFFIEDNTMVFKGCKNGSTPRYYVGYSPDAQEFKLQETDMTKGYDGETYDARGTYNIFEKLNK